MKIVWHYTYSNSIKKILDSGVLLPPILCLDSSDATVQKFGDGGKTADWTSDAKMLLFSQRETDKRTDRTSEESDIQRGRRRQSARKVHRRCPQNEGRQSEVTVLIKTKAPTQRYHVIADDFGNWSDEHSDVLVGDFDTIEQARDAAKPYRKRPRWQHWTVSIFTDEGRLTA